MPKRTLLAGLAVSVIIGGVAFAAVLVTSSGTSCTSGFGPVDSPLTPLDADELSGLVRVDPAAGVDAPSWALLSEDHLTQTIVDVGDWVVHLADETITRIDADGQPSWSWGADRSPLLRLEVLGDNRLGVIWRSAADDGLIVLDAAGEVVACRRFGDVVDGPALDRAGGSAVVELVDETADGPVFELVRRAADGSERWRSTVDDRQPDRRDWEFSRVSVTNTTSYVGAVGSDPGVIALEDRTGEARWRQTTDELDGAFVSALGETADTVHVLAADDTRGHVVALDRSSGDVRWRSETLDRWSDLRFGSATVVDDLVIVRSRDTAIALDAVSGDERWRVEHLQVVAPFQRREVIVVERAGTTVGLFPGPGTLVDLADGSRISWIADDPLGSGIAEIDGVVVHDIEALPVGSGEHLVLGWRLDLDELVRSALTR